MEMYSVPREVGLSVICKIILYSFIHSFILFVFWQLFPVGLNVLVCHKKENYSKNNLIE